MYQIVDLSPEDHPTREQAAALLHAVFQPISWATLDEARQEIDGMLVGERFLQIALEDAPTPAIVGMIGGIPQYDGRVWELHALAVRADHRGRGLGRALVQAFEAQVKARGGLTIILGTDDEDDRTSLSGTDLYVDLWDKVMHIRNLRGHPYEFYQKLGFVITGVVPDANGWGKPDILMSKRVS